MWDEEDFSDGDNDDFEFKRRKFWARNGHNLENELHRINVQRNANRIARQKSVNDSVLKGNIMAHMQAMQHATARQELGLNGPRRPRGCPPCPPCPQYPPPNPTARRNLVAAAAPHNLNPAAASRNLIAAIQPTPALPSQMPMPLRNQKSMPLTGVQVLPAQQALRPQLMMQTTKRKRSSNKDEATTDKNALYMQMFQGLYNRMDAYGDAQAQSLAIQQQLHKTAQDSRADLAEIRADQTQQLNSITAKSFFELSWNQVPQWFQLKLKEQAAKSAFRAATAPVRFVANSYVHGAKIVLGPLNAAMSVTIFVVVTAAGCMILYNMGPTYVHAAGVSVNLALDAIRTAIGPLASFLHQQTNTMATGVYNMSMDKYKFIMASVCAGTSYPVRLALKSISIC